MGTHRENYRDWYSKTRGVFYLSNQEDSECLNGSTELIPVFANGHPGLHDKSGGSQPVETSLREPTLNTVPHAYRPCSHTRSTIQRMDFVARGLGKGQQA